jgi:hypothetical protein
LQLHTMNWSMSAVITISWAGSRALTNKAKGVYDWKVASGLISKWQPNRDRCHVTVHARYTWNGGKHLWHTTNSFHVYCIDGFVSRVCVQMVFCWPPLSA